ncbi:uncharacterized protein I303_104900 [Kwoniella dejecticola CBS 10117]|uniref:Uncharacterized protein n=1 Tax=Kwoniella dejecticola CBS 10117 TaxID=1296121 RepID=A0A1A6A407_9TREE|nr:uncharacterized protein I303_05654 [Kwoniella dejecticola CBS 10117]OBR84795.1 hypothetical protein I303_05654 [Kwoniella dejecticola CBS 10117]
MSAPRHTESENEETTAQASETRTAQSASKEKENTNVDVNVDADTDTDGTKNDKQPLTESSMDAYAEWLFQEATAAALEAQWRSASSASGITRACEQATRTERAAQGEESRSGCDSGNAGQNNRWELPLRSAQSTTNTRGVEQAKDAEKEKDAVPTISIA